MGISEKYEYKVIYRIDLVSIRPYTVKSMSLDR